MAPFMQPAAIELDRSKVIVNSSAPNECCLVGADQGIHKWCKPQCKALGEQFAEAMDETDRPVVPQLGRGVVLAQQHHGGIVEKIEAPPILQPKRTEDCTNVAPDERLGRTIEPASEPVGARSLVRWSFLHHPSNLLIGEFVGQHLEVNPRKVESL